MVSIYSHKVFSFNSMEKNIKVTEVTPKSDKPNGNDIISLLNESNIAYSSIDQDNWPGFEYNADVKFRISYSDKNKEIYIEYKVKEDDITAVSNGTNLTDGMDGLATGVSAIVGVTIAVLAYLSGNSIYASYLNIMYIPNTGEVVIFMAAFIGALIGFLWYNTFPAQVFMGDTGSLALGGIIAVAAIIIRKELLIPVLCGIFFIESLSVIMQRAYFKYTKKKYGAGRRIFKMSPLHHHFQKEGIDAIIQRPKQAIPEAKIVVRFWIIAILLCAISIITLKIR